MIRFNYQYVLCRLCLSNNSSLCDIHSSEVEKGSTVAGVVTDLLQLDVSKTDGHPQLVCLNCLHKLYDFKKFKEKCYKAKSKFEMHLQSNKLFLHVRKPNQTADGQVEEKVFPVTFRQKVPESVSENSNSSSEQCAKTVQEEKCIAECNKCAMKFSDEKDFFAHENEHNKEEKPDGSPDVESQKEVNKNEVSASTESNKSAENLKKNFDEQPGKVMEGNQLTCEFFIKEEPAQGLDLLQEDEYSEHTNPRSPQSSQNESISVLPSENQETESNVNGSTKEDGVQIKQEFQENMEQSAEENNMKNISDNLEANPKTRSLLLCIPIAKKLPATNQPVNLPINLQNKVQQPMNIIPRGTNGEEELRKKVIEEKTEQIEALNLQSTQNCNSNVLLSGNAIKISSVESLKENNIRIREEFTQGITEKSAVQNTVKIIPNNSSTNPKPQSLLLCIPIAKELSGANPPQIPLTRPPMPINPMGLQLKSHQRRKVPPKATSEEEEKSKISCDICGKTFTQKHTLKIHKFTHMKIKPYQCTICKKDFAQSSTMRRHMARSHVEKKFHCFLCPRKFAKEKCLEAHIKIHRGYRPFNCSWCNTGFCSKEALDKHEAWHAGDVPFKCDFCGKEFDHKRKISWHIRCSHMSKNEVCSLCGAHFRSEANLKIHMTLHTDERNFMCEVCGKTFRRSNCLRVHRRTHTGERPYQCELCDKRFTQKHCLKGHMERHQRESW